MIYVNETLSRDLEEITLMESDPDTRRFISPYSYSRHQDSIESFDEEHLSIWEDNKLKGFAILAGLDNKEEEIEFRRIVISEKGSGTGKAVIRLILKRCFEYHSTSRVWLDVYNYNQRAKSLYENLGFVEFQDSMNSELMFMEIKSKTFANKQ